MLAYYFSTLAQGVEWRVLESPNLSPCVWGVLPGSWVEQWEDQHEVEMDLKTETGIVWGFIDGVLGRLSGPGPFVFPDVVFTVNIQ